MTLKDGNNVIGTEPINAAGSGSISFIHLSSNKNYTASVKATDMAGNSTTKDSIVSTAPAKPANLIFSNTTYVSTILSWAPSAGATGYNIYMKVNGQPDTLINNSPVTDTLYTINNLTPNTSYTFYVKALSNVGPSDASSDITVITYALPTINGPSIVCSDGSAYSLSSLISGFSVSWQSSSALEKVSSSDSSAVFKAIGSGNGFITASIITPSGQSLQLETKNIKFGPPFEIDVASILFMNYIGTGDYFQIPAGSGNYMYDGVLSVNDYGDLATNFTWTKIAGSSDTFPKIYWTLFGDKKVEVYSKATDKFLILECTANNVCGSVSRDFHFYTGSSPFVPFSVYPNPAVDNVTITLNDTAKENSTLKAAKVSSNTYTIQIWSPKGLVKTISSSQQSTSISLNGFPRGYYFVHLIQNKKIIGKQILIVQ